MPCGHTHNCRFAPRWCKDCPLPPTEARLDSRALGAHRHPLAATATTREAVAAALAQAVGMAEVGVSPTIEALKTTLRDARLLLVETKGYCWNYATCVPCQPYFHSNPDNGAAWDWWSAECTKVAPNRVTGNCRAVKG